MKIRWRLPHHGEEKERALSAEYTDFPFSIWRRDQSDADARPIKAWSGQEAAQKRAKEDWLAGHTDWPVSYCVRDSVSGKIWAIDVALATQPSFVALDAREIEMRPAVHVLWDGRALCEDLRLRGVPRDWPDGQQWISLKEIADGSGKPPDACASCWAKAPELIAGLRQIGSDR